MDKQVRYSNNPQERKDEIIDLANRWASRNPDQMRDTLEYIRGVQDGLIESTFARENKSLTSPGLKSGGMRFGIAIPPGMMNYIQTFVPDFLDTKEDMQFFMRKFPALRVPK